MALGTINIAIVVSKDYQKGLKQAEDDSKKTGKNIEKEFGRSAKRAASAFVRELNKIGGALRTLGTEISKISLPIIGALGLATNEFVKFEDKLADIAKTTGATDEELQNIADSLLRLSRESRTTISDLEDIAIIGGQLGIAVQDIDDFTGAIDKLNVALGDEFLGGAEEITKEVGGLRAIFSDIRSDNIEDDLLRIGNALNILGAEGLATAPIVTEFSKRIGGLAGPLGVSAGDILGLSATLEELQVSAERGGSAVGRIFQLLARDSATFAKELGLNAKQLKDLINKDINEAFILVLKRIKNLNLSTTDLAKLLDDLGISGTGNVEVFQKLSENIDLLNDRQKLSANALKGTTSVLDEFDKKNETTAAALGRLRNAFQEFGITIGKTLEPILRTVIDTITTFINNLTDGFKRLPKPVQTFILSLTLIVAAIGPILVAAGALISSITAIAGALATLAQPILLVIAAIGLLGAAFVALAKRFGLLDEIQKRFEILYTRIRNTINNIKEALQDPEVQQSLDNLKNSFNGLIDSLQPIFDALIRLIQAVFGIPDDLFGEGEDTAFLTVEQAVNVLTIAFDKLAAAIDIVTRVLQPFNNNLARFIDRITFIIEKLREFKDEVIEAWNSPEVVEARNTFRIALEELGKAFSDLKEAVSELFALFSESTETEEQTDKTEEQSNKVIELKDALVFLIGTFRLTIQIITVVIGVFNLFINNLRGTIQTVSELGLTIANVVASIFVKFNELRAFILETILKILGYFNITLPKGIQDAFNNLVARGKTFGRNLGNAIVGGFQATIGKLRNVVSSVTSGATAALSAFFTEGGVVRLAQGGLVPKLAKMVYAQNGLFTPRGTDTVPAMLTPGELVIPRSLTNQLFSVLQGISRLNGVSSRAQLDGVNVNIASMYATDASQARQRGGDLGFGVYTNLRAKGLI